MRAAYRFAAATIATLGVASFLQNEASAKPKKTKQIARISVKDCNESGDLKTCPLIEKPTILVQITRDDLLKLQSFSKQ